MITPAAGDGAMRRIGESPQRRRRHAELALAHLSMAVLAALSLFGGPSRGDEYDADLARDETACLRGREKSCARTGVHRLLDCAPNQSRACRRAVQLFTFGCGHGEPAACNQLAGMYLEGQGVNLDLGRAADLYRRACDGDEPQACNLLAGMLLDGRGVRADREAAIRTYDKACRLHDPDACPVLKQLRRAPRP